MVDPSSAMHSFQEVASQKQIQLVKGLIYPEVSAFGDSIEGKMRLTYVLLEKDTVTAFVNIIKCSPIERTPCFQIGYAVPEVYRNQGRAKELVVKALAEMRNGFRQYIPFYIEAIVGADNKPSQRVAEHAISSAPKSMIDKISGLPAFQYLLKVE